MSKPNNSSYEFGPYCLDPTQRLLLRADEHIQLPPKIFDLLLFLVQRKGQLVEKEEIIRHLWPDSFVEEGNLTNNISILRKALGDTAKDPKYIATLPKHGYRFVANVKALEDGGVEPAYEEGATFPAGNGERAEGIGGIQEEAHVSARVHAEHNVTRRFKVFVFASVILVSVLVVALYFRRTYTPAPAAVSSASSVRSIAVLPFKPLESKGGDSSLQLGMADSMIMMLSNLDQITVLPLSTVRRYTASAQDVIKAGRELGVESVLDGSIQRSQDRIRVRVNLVRVRDGQSLWADQFDEKFTDIFTVQAVISERVAAALELKLSSNATRQLRKRYTENADAYEAYLRGRYFWGNRGDLKKAIEEFNQAIALDDKYALAFADLADCYNVLPGYGGLSPLEAYTKARAAAMKAVELDNTMAEAHTALAKIKANYDWDWPGAEAEFKRAIELNPNYSCAHYFYALNYLAPMGKLAEAEAELRRALDLEPHLLIINTNLGSLFYFEGRYDEAIKQYRKVLKLDPRFVTTHLRLIEVYMQTGRYDEALAEHEIIVQLGGTENPQYVKQLKEALRQSGSQGYWRKRLDQAKERMMEKAEFVPAISLAGFAARLGDNEQAFRWLEKAYEEQDGELVELKVDPRFESLRADPRYTDLLRRIHLGP
jgi:DNA-binding winged helix-turn-helix (wHTH) protein/TolB-like protein/lipopolysaccharide biosynthesis regulator YciM